MIIKFKKWLSGEITWKEEKELRQQAFEDKFLSDAMEGYEQFPATNHIQKVHQLNRRIREKSGKSSSKFLPRAIAASFLVLISASAFWWINSNVWNATSQDMALDQASISTKEAIQSSEVATITESEQAEALVAVPEDPVASPTPKASSTPPVQAPPTELRTTAKTEINNDAYSKTSTLSKIPEDIVPLETPKPRSLPIPEVQRETPAAAEALAIEDARQNSPTPTTMPDEAKRETILPSPKETTPRMAAARKAFPTADVINKSRTLNALESNTSISMGSIFDDFIKENLEYPAMAKQNGIKGVVRLTYQITTDGQLDNITVVDSLGYGCEEEAIRLLQSFPFPVVAIPIDTFVVKFE